LVLVAQALAAQMGNKEILVLTPYFQPLHLTEAEAEGLVFHLRRMEVTEVLVVEGEEVMPPHQPLAVLETRHQPYHLKVIMVELDLPLVFLRVQEEAAVHLLLEGMEVQTLAERAVLGLHHQLRDHQ
jgi:hypothetical protein